MFRTGKSIKTSLLVIIILIAWIHIFLNYGPDSDSTSLLSNLSKRSNDKNSLEEDKTGKSNFLGNVELGRLGTPGFINVPEPGPLTEEEIKEVSLQIENINEEQKIYNLDKFGPLTDESFVLVIQIHSRVEYLSLLLESLARVQSIENALIIFSHDLFVPELNEAIQSVDFTRVMQIFYPFSIQLNPNRFPGQSPDDCQRDISVKKAQEIKCRNAGYPDGYGHYREARYTQTKHHWWWKANFIFSRVRVLQNFTGVITFLEEDHYVTPDFLWVLNLMETLMNRNRCHGCNLLALGTYLKTWNIRSFSERMPALLKSVTNLYTSSFSLVSQRTKNKAAFTAQAVVTNWISSKHNMGMAFNRTMWSKLKSCAEVFCRYDDYNWDWSLLDVSYKCLSPPLSVLYAKAPRIFHIGDCGVHHKTKLCDPTTAARTIDKNVERYKAFLYPDNLVVEDLKAKKLKLKKGNGGWGDLRDHELCLSF